MRVAYFSPLPPMRSGIADYSAALLPHLSAHVDLDVFIEDYTAKIGDLGPRVRIRPWREFELEHASGRYDAVLYHIGNNGFHGYIYDMAVRVPGVVMLHEFNIHYLLAEVTLSRGDWDGYFRELEYNAGPEALEHARRAQRGEVQPEYGRFPMNRRLLEVSRGAIVHSDYMAGLVRGAGFQLPVSVIPHGVAFPEVDREQARDGFGLGAAPVVGSFGFLKPYKRLHSLLRAAARLRRGFPDLQILLVGEEHLHYPLRPLIRELGLESCIRLPGFVSLDQFHDYIAACDVCVNLRYPTVGESSGSLLRELAMGKPVIVSDVGAFSELPDDVCVKIPAGKENEETAWLEEYLRALLNDPALSISLGAAAKRWAQENCAWPKVANRYAAALARFAFPGGAAVSAAFEGEALDHKTREAFGLDAGGTPAPPGNAAPPGNNGFRDYILSFSRASRAMEDYVRVHLNRLVHTLQITPPASPGAQRTVLEMGCYMQLTPALRQYLGYSDIRGCYYGRAGDSEEKTVYSTTGESFSCRIDLFDAEKDTYPYPDASFDTVLCCELIEHLYHDPMHMMSEINRVLKPGGHLVLTTPNITSVRGVNAILNGYHPGLFHTYVVPRQGAEADPRHNREFAPRDVKALAENAGFELVRLETGWYEERPPRFEALESLLSESGYSTYLRGDIIYAVARKIGPVRERYPAELYTAF